MRHEDLGPDYYDRRAGLCRQIAHHVGKLGALGLEVTLCRIRTRTRRVREHPDRLTPVAARRPLPAREGEGSLTAARPAKVLSSAQVVHPPPRGEPNTGGRFCCWDLWATAVMITGAYTLLTYTSLMAMTTIRVETELRDRLAAQAAANGRSLGAELRAMMDEMMWQGIEAGYRKLAASREEMAAYQAEAAEWTSAGLGDLASAADEYPEYNS
jgi:plasmid stability protein